MKKIWNSKKLAISLSYVAIVVQTISTIILTKIYVTKLGADMYGLYQMIYSVANYILILDLGISTTMIRFIAEYDQKKQEKKKENFLFHFLIIVMILVLVVIIIGVIINTNLEFIYSSLSADDLIISHQLFSIMIFQIILTLISHYLDGITLANEQYAVAKLLDTSNLVINFILIILFLKFGFGIIGISIANLIVVLMKIIILVFFDFFKLKVKIRFHGLDLKMLQPAFLLMFAMLLQSVVGNVNNSVDKTILGIMSTKNEVAIYAIAATFITIFNSLPYSISAVYQTTATKLVVSGADNEQLTNFVIKPGRFQLIITGGFIIGFLLLGREFIICWTGKKMINAWLYALIIMIPNAIPLVQNTCNLILNAMDKRIYRSLILTCITLINIVLTIFFIKWFGPIGAPIATAISYIIGHIILMNLYYYFKLHLDIFKMFRGILKKISTSIIITFLLNLPLYFLNSNGNWILLLIKMLIFVIIYFIILLIYGFNIEEKTMVNNIYTKIRKKINIYSKCKGVK